jgi:V/A-type H+-transporting ATPase subunit I
MEASKSINIDQEVSQLKQEQERLNSRLDELKSRAELVHGLEFINADLSVLDLESAASFFGTLTAAAYVNLAKSLSQLSDVMVYSSGTETVNVVAVVPRKSLEEFGSIIQKADVRMQRIPPMKGTASEVLSNVEVERSASESKLQSIDGQLRALSQKYFGIISSVEEQLSIEAKKLEVLSNIGFTDNAFALEGWIPAKRLPGLKDIMGRYSASTNILDIEAESGDKPPTLMENPKRLRFFESFIRFYSLPQSNEFDPTILFAFTFPIFFGLMLGEAPRTDNHPVGAEKVRKKHLQARPVRQARQGHDTRCHNRHLLRRLLQRILWLPLQPVPLLVPQHQLPLEPARLSHH